MKTGLGGFLDWLAERRARHAEGQPPILWKTWTAVTLFFVAAAMLFRDEAVTLAARKEPQWLRTLADNTTDFGKSGWILTLSGVIFAVAYYAYRHLRDTDARRETARYASTAAAHVFLSVALSGLIANIAKRAIGRARPPLFDAEGAFHFKPFSGALHESFPSGHATTDGAIAMALAILFPRYRVPILVIGAYFAATRLMVGAHYLSDITAGYSFGMWYAYMSALFFARHGFSLKPPKG